MSHCDNACQVHMATAQVEYWAAEDLRTPHVLLRPRIYIDGNQWCALYGENLQDGIAGFGDTVELAMLDFDKNYSNYKIDTK